MKARRMKGKAGFTIVELMIIIAIVGILAAIGIPAYLERDSRIEIKDAWTIKGNTYSYNITIRGKGIAKGVDKDAIKERYRNAMRELVEENLPRQER